MTSDGPSGAIDNEFDDFEESPRHVLEENLSAFAAEVKPGDVVIDMVENRPLYVRRVKADTAVEFFEEQDFDLTTYKAHPWLPVTPDDTVFETVFLPTKLKDIPTSEGDKTYDYPRGRLARVPIEFLWDSRKRWVDNQYASLVAATIVNVDGHDRDVDVEAVFEAMQVAVGEDVARDGLERAGIDFADDAEFGDFDPSGGDE